MMGLWDAVTSYACNLHLVPDRQPHQHRITQFLQAGCSYPQGWLVGVEFNAPLDTVWVISEAVFTANHLTDTDKQNSTGKYK